MYAHLNSKHLSQANTTIVTRHELKLNWIWIDIELQFEIKICRWNLSRDRLWLDAFKPCYFYAGLIIELTTGHLKFSIYISFRCSEISTVFYFNVFKLGNHLVHQVYASCGWICMTNFITLFDFRLLFYLLILYTLHIHIIMFC